MGKSARRIAPAARLADGRRCFTPHEANCALVLVKRIVADITEDYARLEELQEIIDAAQLGDAGRGARQAQEDIVIVAERLQHCAEEIEEIGVELKDWSAGVVDFPCLAEGRVIWLCWRLGEPKVAHWHEVDAGFAERQPVSTMPGNRVLTDRKAKVAAGESSRHHPMA